MTTDEIFHEVRMLLVRPLRGGRNVRIESPCGSFLSVKIAADLPALVQRHVRLGSADGTMLPGKVSEDGTVCWITPTFEEPKMIDRNQELPWPRGKVRFDDQRTEEVRGSVTPTRSASGKPGEPRVDVPAPSRAGDIDRRTSEEAE